MRETPSIAKVRPRGSVPLWVAVHEAGHVMARSQLLAAWRLDGLDDPSALDSARVRIDERGHPRGLCRWGNERLCFRYQAIISAAGPSAEAHIRHADPYECLMAGEDLDIVMRSVRRGIIDIDEALKEASFIVRSCWPEIMILGTYLQIHHELTFPQVSTLLDLKNCRGIYNERNRPDIRSV